MEGTGMLVANFGFNPQKRPIWVWPKLMQTLKVGLKVNLSEILRVLK